MKRKIAASLSIILLAGAPSVINAEDCCMPEFMPGEPICDGCTWYSQYAGVQLDCGWDVYALGEFLYWRPSQTVCWVAEVIPQNILQQPQTILPFNFGYRPGFRVGLGMVAHCFDDWIFNVDYLRYHQGFSKTMSETLPNNLTSLLTFPGTLVGSIRNKTHFHYDIVGLNMQRPNYLGQRVIFSPFLGLKWLKRDVEIAQDLIDRAGGVSTYRSILKYTSIGIGAGFEGSWLLCWGLSLTGDVDVAALYAYKRSYSQVATPAAGPIVNLGHHIRHLDIYAKGGVGVSWGSYLCCNRYHVRLGMTYDFMADIVKLDGYGLSNGSALLTGLSVRGQFDF